MFSLTSPTSSLRFFALALVLVLGSLACADAYSAQRSTIAPPGTKHQLWLVSTRCASSSNPSVQQASRLKYWRCDSDRQWRLSNLSELLGTDDPETTTLVYVHENRVSRRESFYRAWTVFVRLSRVAPADKRFRLIVISWPSDRIGRRQRPDVQIKAQRSEAHGFYLAWLLDQIHPDVRIGVFGYSFGPRVITTALHHLGGGAIYGRRLDERVHAVRKPIRVVLMAAALDAHWLYPGQHHGRALTQVEHMLIITNPRDSVLRFYPHLYRLLCGGPPALGTAGVRRDERLHPHQDKVVEWNVAGQVGGTHSWKVYGGSSSMMAQIAPHLFGE
jgi:hypothetical protein